MKNHTNASAGSTSSAENTVFITQAVDGGKKTPPPFASVSATASQRSHVGKTLRPVSSKKISYTSHRCYRINSKLYDPPIRCEAISIPHIQPTNHTCTAFTQHNSAHMHIVIHKGNKTHKEPLRSILPVAKEITSL